MSRPAIFLDRDGIINAVSQENKEPQSPRNFKDFKLLAYIAEPLKLFKNLGFLNIIVTNQPDIARGLLDKKELEKMHQLIKEKLQIDDILVCAHDDRDNCACRKPRPGLILGAAKKWGIELKQSYMVGDTYRDMQAGKSVGCTTVLLSRPYNQHYQENYDLKIGSLDELAQIIKTKGANEDETYGTQ